MTSLQSSILIVDDEHDNLDVLTRALQSAGYQVVVVSHGQAAFDHAVTSPPDVVLAGVSVPGMNGFQLCRALKHRQETQDVPILLMGTRTEPADHFWAEEVGAVALLPRSRQMSTLVATVTSTLSRN